MQQRKVDKGEISSSISIYDRMDRVSTLHISTAICEFAKRFLFGMVEVTDEGSGDLIIPARTEFIAHTLKLILEAVGTMGVTKIRLKAIERVYHILIEHGGKPELLCEDREIYSSAKAAGFTMKVSGSYVLLSADGIRASRTPSLHAFTSNELIKQFYEVFFL